MQAMMNFNVKCFIDAAEELLRADEITRALQLLDNLPAYFRDYEPKEVTNLRNEILKRIATPSFYRDCDKDFELCDFTPVKDTLRYELVKKDIDALNKKQIVPYVHDYAPGSFFIPVLLKSDGLSFRYGYTDLGHTAAEKVKPLIEDRLAKQKPNDVKMFLALEIIEHLWHESELKTEMLKAVGFADIIHISTPKYSYDYTCLNWMSRETLGHLRAYTPREFFETVQKIFGEYNFTFYDSQILHAVGALRVNKTT